MSAPTQYVKAQPIAAEFNVTVRTVHQWAAKGDIPSVRFKGTVRFDPAAVRAAITGKPQSEGREG